MASPSVGDINSSTSLTCDSGLTPQRSLSNGPNNIQREIIPSASKPVLRGSLPLVILYLNFSPKSSSLTRIGAPKPNPTGDASQTSRD